MTIEFKKATLQEVSPTPVHNPQPVPETLIYVQINPASLRLQMQNNVDAGKAFARPATGYQGSQSSTLSFDLLFDTADEGDTDNPVDVRTRTRQLERFLLPSTSSTSSTSAKSAPPGVQFTYGTLTVVGVMTAMNQDFDFFAVNGVPLRAKCAVTIKEQKPEFEAKQKGQGANTGAGATAPLAPGAGAGGAPGAAPVAPPDRTGTALAGESAAGFAGRMGLDPRAWKDLAAAVTDPLSLDAGLQIDFSASMSLDVGLGVEVGATAGTAAEQGRAPAPPATPVPAQPPAEGPALTAAGGLTRALDRDTTARTTLAADVARDSFGARPLTRATAAPPPGVPAVSAPAGGAQAPGASRSAAPSHPDTRALAVTVDPRSVSFGFGVPLRERRGAVRRAAVGLVRERSRRVAPAPGDGVPESDDPTVPRWEALPASPFAVTAAVGSSGMSGCAWGCGGTRR